MPCGSMRDLHHQIKAGMLLVTLKRFFLLFVIQIIMANFHQSTTEACEANVIRSCVNNTTCAQTYGEVYNALASQKNYFNIAQALYPAKKPSSVLVHVWLHGANGTENCTPAAYTWSMSCLCAAFPAQVLEVLSLGSILLSSRVQELNITIPPFCCNVSTDDRMTMVDKVLAAVCSSLLEVLKVETGSVEQWSVHFYLFKFIH